jgi:hypothetical protein
MKVAAVLIQSGDKGTVGFAVRGLDARALVTSAPFATSAGWRRRVQARWPRSLVDDVRLAIVRGRLVAGR